MADLIEEVLKASDEDVEFFSDIIAKNIGKFSDNEKYRIASTAKFKEEIQKAVRIHHGNHEEHYVWHVSPAHPKKPWAVAIDRVLYAIGKVLNDSMPNEIVVDIYLPDKRYDMNEITVKANGAMSHWSMKERDFHKITGKLFEVLNTLF
jgi:hypothetical protein